MTNTPRPLTPTLHGGLVVDKPPGPSSFAVIEALQRALVDTGAFARRSLPKMGHGGTLDPFATGSLVVLVGDAVKLSRYFLGATKRYSGVMAFGETTTSGDATDPVTESTPALPADCDTIAEMARRMTLQPYLQTPPMHSAKKHHGRPLYELARQGLEVERAPKLCQLSDFEIHSYKKPFATFSVTVSSGTYVRTLAQDLGRLLGSLAHLTELRRESCGPFGPGLPLDTIVARTKEDPDWTRLEAWVPFDELLRGLPRCDLTPSEAEMFRRGQQNVILGLRSRLPQEAPVCAAYCHGKLTAVLRLGTSWEIERVFTREVR